MSRRRRGSVALGGAEASGGGKGWLGLLVLPLLLALLIVGLIAFNEDDAESPERASTPPAEQPAPEAGMLTVDGRSVAPGSPLGALVGRTAELRGVEVQQVDGRSGFFVGGGKGERTFVEWGPRAGGDEATTMPKVGDRVDVTGPVEEPPEQPGRTFGVPVASERVILKQGGYVNADRVVPAR